MKKTIWIAVVILLMLGVWWFAKDPKTVDGETIKIGGAFGLSGICAEFGEGELRAVTLAIEEVNAAGGVNGKLLELITEDTQCENKTTVNAFQKLINVNRVSAIIGPTWGDSFQGGYAISQKAKVVSVSPSTAIEALEI
ncbi:MAG: ABC transporter substrate-binding protein, partial [bacterium]|nr:ABC transporter substrate-binding protein [bacterium]